MALSAAATISVVISTFERPEACERALLSVLAQDHAPLEILVCDDGSRDETAERFTEWARRYPNVRYLRCPVNTGTPAAPRNLGVAHARGEWVAFLDDDDSWLPHKLTCQREVMSEGAADLIASNALRSSGQPYFPGAPARSYPARRELLKDNPIIVSSAAIRRSLAKFPVARWMRGVADYAAWLYAAEQGARIVVLGEPLVRYDDAGDDRMSAARAKQELAVARMVWERVFQSPHETAKLAAALRRTALAAHVFVTDYRPASRWRP